MVEISSPGFLVGEMAWVSDGRSGRIAGGNFNADAGEWLWALDGVGGPFRESDLFHFDPTAAPPLALPELPSAGQSVSSEDLREAIESVVELINSIPVGMARAAVAEMVENGTERAIEASMAFTLEETSAMRDSLALSIGGVQAGLSTQLEELESTVVPALSQLENRLDSLEGAAEEETGMSIRDFFRGLGSFLSSPLGFILDKGRDSILSEISDGLNR